MHLGNEALTPECAAIAFGAAAAGLGISVLAIRREPIHLHKLALAAGLGSLVFAAQAVNVPILPGVSAHLVGGVLLAWALGLGLGAWTMAIVLTIQALVLGDGGLLSLGANVLNMALLPAGMVAAAGQASQEHHRMSWVRAGVISAVSVPLAAVLIVGETACFRSGAELTGWSDFAVRMIGTHLWIGLAEGGASVLLLAALAQFKTEAGEKPSWRPVWASLGAAAVLGVACLWSSALPDGYEAAAERSGLEWLLADAGEKAGR